MACPSQWEGETEDGKEVYIRYRWGYGRIDLDGETIYDWGGENGFDGVCEDEELLAVFNKANIIMMEPIENEHGRFDEIDWEAGLERLIKELTKK